MSSGIRVSVGAGVGVALGEGDAGIEGVCVGLGDSDTEAVGTGFGRTFPLFQTNFRPDLMHVY
jgi:hypothetical protein